MSSLRMVMRSSSLSSPLVGHLERQHQHRNLDHAGAVEDLAVADAGGLAGREVLDPDAGLAGKLRRRSGQQVVKRRGLQLRRRATAAGNERQATRTELSRVAA